MKRHLIDLAVTMFVPDTIPIIEVILFSQGFIEATSLSRKIYIFFKLANEQLSLQKHYDFGLRSIKVWIERA
jgi:dynein heavy chain